MNSTFKEKICALLPAETIILGNMYSHNFSCHYRVCVDEQYGTHHRWAMLNVLNFSVFHTILLHVRAIGIKLPCQHLEFETFRRLQHCY